MKNKFNFILILLAIQFFYQKSDVYAQCEPLDLGNDTILCEGGAIILDAGPAQTYDWMDGASREQSFSVTEPGKYWVEIIDNCGDIQSDTIMIELAALPEINLSLIEREYYCKGEVIDLNSSIENPDENVIYNWSSNVNDDPVSSIDTTGQYKVTAIDENGCKNSLELYLEFQYPFEKEKIQLASYDKLEDKFFVVWSRTEMKRTKEYIVFNGLNENDQLGTVDFRYKNMLVDQKTDPHVSSSFYNLMVRDSCDNLSNLREIKAHKTMFLQVETDADNNSLLSWERYIGFDFEYYYIFRGQDPDRLVKYDSVINDVQLGKYSFKDSETNGNLYYYQILINTPDTVYVNESTKKAGSGPFLHSLSNLEDNKVYGTGLEKIKYIRNNFTIYPNPVSNQSKIKFKVIDDSEINISLYNILGNHMKTIVNRDFETGEYNITLQRSELDLPSGIYILQMQSDQLGMISKRVVVK